MKESAARIKFKLHRLSQADSVDNQWQMLASALKKMDEYGCTPQIDGSHTGNIACRIEDGMLVSESNRSTASIGPHNFVKVVKFNLKIWEAHYVSLTKESRPTSDTPLYWASLVEIPKDLGWIDRPHAAVHGHLLASDKAASDLNIPISKKETEFGTPEDLEALLQLFYRYPYPQNKVFIRKGHGFFVLETNVQDTMKTTLKIISRGKSLNLI